MGKIIGRTRERQAAAFKKFSEEMRHQLLLAHLATTQRTVAEEAVSTLNDIEHSPDHPRQSPKDAVGGHLAQLSKRVHSLEFQVLRLTPGTAEWVQARKEQFERRRQAEDRQFLARRAERRAFWGAIARLLGFRRG